VYRWFCQGALGVALLCQLSGCPRASLHPPFDRQLRDHLDQERIQQQPMGEWLDQLAAESCLGELESLPGALAALRRLHRTTYEHADPAERRAIWQAWRRRLESMSPDGRRLVEVYLDSPARARQLFLCDDTLPASWQGMDAEAYPERALLYYEGQVLERQPEYRAGGADGARAVEELRELSWQIKVRYRAQYDERGSAAGPYRELERELAALWARHVDRFDVGLPVSYVDKPLPPPDVEPPADAGLPATYSDHPDAHLAGTTGLETHSFGAGGLPWSGGLDIPLSNRPYGPSLKLGDTTESVDREDEIRFANGTTLADIPGGGNGVSVPVPDPKDVIMAQRIIDSWRTARRELVRQIGEQEGRVAALERDLGGAGDEDRDALRAELVRATNTLGHLTADLARHGNSLAGKRTGRAVADKLVAAAVPAESRATRRAQRAAATVANQARDVVSGTEPDAPSSAGAAAGAHAPDTGTVHTQGSVATNGTPSGGPAPAIGDPPAPAHGSTLIYEGPCPLPDPRWSDQVVAALLTHDRSLDETDARIVLSLIQRALPADIVQGVEEVVLDHLRSGYDLQLRRGHVDRLSDVVDPSVPAAEQTVIQFQVTLDLGTL